MPFQDLPARLADVREQIGAAAARGGHGQEVTVVAVTKTYGPEAAAAAWEAGLRDVGENKVQEATAKMAQVSAPLRWHLIGHLQRNKVKLVDDFHLVHSMDSARLADALAAHGAARGEQGRGGRPVDVLMQVNVLGEASKGGYAPEDVEREAARLRTLAGGGVRVHGVMTMAPFDAEERVLRTVFGAARRCGEQLRAAGHERATVLSMGMSGDYVIAVEEGATLVRLGTVLFGARSS